MKLRACAAVVLALGASACSSSSPVGGSPAVDAGGVAPHADASGSKGGRDAAGDAGTAPQKSDSGLSPDSAPAVDATTRHDAGQTRPDAGEAQPDAVSEATVVPLPDASSPPGDGKYGANGPASVTMASLTVPAPNGNFTTVAYIPSTAGPHPVVILSSGFFQNAAAYAPYATRLASWGVVTLLRDDPELAESTPNEVDDVEYTVSTWLAATNGDSSSPLHGALDLTKVGLAGHSRGGQVAFLAGEGLSGKILGVFGLDPVDQSTGSNPEARTTLATIGVPVGFIGETTDSTGGVAGMPCAPAADNYLVLYGAAASPAVAITAVNADHTMFELASACFLCNECTPGTASQPAVLAAAVRYLTAFFGRTLLGDTTVGAAFQGAGASEDVASGLVTLESK